MKIGKYTPDEYNDKGNVFSVQDVSPYLESAMGTGGNHVPTFVEIHADGMIRRL